MRRAMLFAVVMIGAAAAFLQIPAALAQVPYDDLWTPEVLQKIRDQNSLNLRIVPHFGYFEIFFNSEVNSAKWFEDNGSPDFLETAPITMGTIRIHGYLATPGVGGPYPALVIGHGHRSRGSPEAALALAALGYVGFSIDGPGQGESTGPPDTEQRWIDVEPSADFSYLYHYAYAGMRALTALERMSTLFLNPFRIDRNKLGVIGASMGGTLVYHMNGVDDRIKAAVAIASAGDWDPLLFYPGSWLYHGLYYYTHDGLRTQTDALNAISNVCTDNTLFNFLEHFDPLQYASRQHGPLLTIIGTHDQYFTVPAMNTTYNQTASAGTNPRFITRIQFSPNAEHGVINEDDSLFVFLSVLRNVNQWLIYSFRNGPAPMETPNVTMTVSGNEMSFAVSVIGGGSPNVKLFAASQMDTSLAQPKDFGYIQLKSTAPNLFTGSIPIGATPPTGPPLTPDNILYFAQAEDTAFTVSSKMYYRTDEMHRCSSFVPVLEHFPRDTFDIPPAPASSCGCP